ncbi:MAG: hypothetical protein M3Y56_14830, partial [Armatimonadota bacterium]|nr:hypothetical protein [Armatimonadota bacterium]
MSWESADFITLSGPESPKVAYALRWEPDHLRLAVDVDRSVGGGGMTLLVGVAAVREVTLNSSSARVLSVSQNRTRFEFSIPAEALIDRPEDWSKLRLGLAVNWTGGPFGEDRQRERFLQMDNESPHNGLSPNPSVWTPINLQEHAALVADQKAKIFIPFVQPMDGKASVIVEDVKGRRIRNLISGQPTSHGPQQAPWDGLDENGVPVAPGTYRWRAVFHPGITPHYLFSFANAPGSNHSTFQAATRNTDLIFFASPVTEGGWNMIALDSSGKMQTGFNWGWGVGLDKVAIAADDHYVYVAHDGFSNAQSNNVDRGKPDWKGDYTIQLERFDIKSGSGVDFPHSGRVVTVQSTEVGPGSAEKRPDRVGLQGMALMGGKLYISDYHTNSLMVFDPTTGARTGEIKLQGPGVLAADGDTLVAASSRGIVRIDPGTNTSQILVLPDRIIPAGLAVGQDASIYASDQQGQNVKVFDRTGSLLREIGKPGGEYAGVYDPLRMIHPAGLVVAQNGWLWVTEEGRWTPKRLSAYDPKTGGVVHEQFGPTHYGASGAGFDNADPARWIGLDTLWQLNLTAKTAAPKSILGPSGATHFHFLHRDGRTFLIGLGGATTLDELRKDGSAKPLATIGSVHR